MGNCISGILSSIFMDTLEQQALQNRTFCLFRRYVDDGIIITTDEAEATAILERMAAQNPAISFEIERPQCDTLSLLDFSITIKENVSFCFFKKSARKDIFVNFNSAIPTNSKISCIQNEINRIEERCTTNKDKVIHTKKFANSLAKNDYPNHFIQRVMNSKKKHRRRPQRAEDHVYLRLPFLSDKFFYKVQRIFHRAKLPVRIYDKNTTLRHALARKRPSMTCKTLNCIMKDSGFCFVKKCVYKITCDSCSSFYIGSTLRALHSRVKEHMEQTTSSVFQHKRICAATFQVRILKKAPDNTTLRFLEALLIAKQGPTMNNKQEREEIRSLLFE